MSRHVYVRLSCWRVYNFNFKGSQTRDFAVSYSFSSKRFQRELLIGRSSGDFVEGQPSQLSGFIVSTNPAEIFQFPTANTQSFPVRAIISLDSDIGIALRAPCYDLGKFQVHIPGMSTLIGSVTIGSSGRIVGIMLQVRVWGQS
jgi:hypothetical protein